jgi:hypothetical protein
MTNNIKYLCGLYSAIEQIKIVMFELINFILILTARNLKYVGTFSNELVLISLTANAKFNGLNIDLL